jgi:hypothetical protein
LINYAQKELVAILKAALLCYHLFIFVTKTNNFFCCLSFSLDQLIFIELYREGEIKGGIEAKQGRIEG